MNQGEIDIPKLDGVGRSLEASKRLNREGDEDHYEENDQELVLECEIPLRRGDGSSRTSS